MKYILTIAWVNHSSSGINIIWNLRHERDLEIHIQFDGTSPMMKFDTLYCNISHQHNANTYNKLRNYLSKWVHLII